MPHFAKIVYTSFRMLNFIKQFYDTFHSRQVQITGYFAHRSLLTIFVKLQFKYNT